MTKGAQKQSSRLSQSGISDVGHQADALSIQEVENIAVLRLRATSAIDEIHLQGHDLPDRTGECSGQVPTILCLRPGEWLVISETTSGESLLSEYEYTQSDQQLYSWDQTDGLAMVRLQGPAAHWLMRKNSGLDFHVTSSTPDHCAQCRFGKISVIVHFHRDTEGTGVFDLLMDRSLVRYLWTLLVSTAPHAEELEKGVLPW
ncbi:MAG TPA: hypothetical protein VJ984_12445 [Xanthomonadales bacterium]|nr:hypothetical protein [Xanthomonadales bacterium]